MIQKRTFVPLSNFNLALNKKKTFYKQKKTSLIEANYYSNKLSHKLLLIKFRFRINFPRSFKDLII